MNALQFNPAAKLNGGQQSSTYSSSAGAMKTLPENSQLTGEMPYLQMRANLAAANGRSLSYDSNTFARMYGSEDTNLNLCPDDPFTQPGLPSGLQNQTSGPPMLMVQTNCGTRSPRKSASGSMPNSPMGRLRGNGTTRASPLVRSFNLRDTATADFENRLDSTTSMPDISRHFDPGQSYLAGCGHPASVMYGAISSASTGTECNLQGKQPDYFAGHDPEAFYARNPPFALNLMLLLVFKIVCPNEYSSD
eukprot:scaffold181101_cov39-Prasinocladus_malaysianus.AAC.1